MTTVVGQTEDVTPTTHAATTNTAQAETVSADSTTCWRSAVNADQRRWPISRPLPSTEPVRPWLRRVVTIYDTAQARQINEVYMDFMSEVERIVNGSRPLVLCCPMDVLDDIGYLLYHDMTMAVLGHTDDFPRMVTPRLCSIHRRLLRIVLRMDAAAVRAAG